LVGSLDTAGYAEAVAAVRSLALVADGDNGLLLVDFSSPTSPAVVGHYQTPGWANDVVVAAEHVYVADHGWGLQILGLWSAFKDVPFDHWAFYEIEGVAVNNVVVGYPDGLYHPEILVSRAQMAIYVARAVAGGDDSVPDGPAVATFPDVPDDDVAYKYVEYAFAQGIVTGYVEEGLYHPEYIVDRGQMAIFIARSMATPVGEAGLIGYVPPITPTFDDVTPATDDP
jgi:hypothetical protein